MSHDQLNGSITIGVDMDYLARRVADLVVNDLVDRINLQSVADSLAIRIAVQLPAVAVAPVDGDYVRTEDPVEPIPDDVGGYPLQGEGAKPRFPTQPPPPEQS